MDKKDVIVIGGGLAGLISGILLSRAGLNVLIIEKKKFPFHRVCGEYISNEVTPFLKKNALFPHAFVPAQIDQLRISATNGKKFDMELDLGGFGISRFAFDHWLYEEAKRSGVEVWEGHEVDHVTFADHSFRVNVKEKLIRATLVIAAHGKRSRLDRSLKRKFIETRSPYVGVKYHVEADLPGNRIALHNFSGGYCGVIRIEGGIYNVCYLSHRNNIRNPGSIEGCEREVLFQNPYLRDLFTNSRFLFDKPEVINEISFAPKEPVKDHIFYTGDAAGMITPLCGNGMAMAIHSAKILAECIIKHWGRETLGREQTEKEYSARWKRLFQARLWAGRKIQSLFGARLASQGAVFLGSHLKPVARSLVRLTHGRPFA